MVDVVDEKTFDEYWRENPRAVIPDKMMEAFLLYAKEKYLEERIVNHAHFNSENDTEEDVQDEVTSYIGESMEALLLFKEWLRQREGGKAELR